jgi:hypothetical protein
MFSILSTSEKNAWHSLPIFFTKEAFYLQIGLSFKCRGTGYWKQPWANPLPPGAILNIYLIRIKAPIMYNHLYMAMAQYNCPDFVMRYQPSAWNICTLLTLLYFTLQIVVYIVTVTAYLLYGL